MMRAAPDGLWMGCVGDGDDDAAMEEEEEDDDDDDDDDKDGDEDEDKDGSGFAVRDVDEETEVPPIRCAIDPTILKASDEISITEPG